VRFQHSSALKTDPSTIVDTLSDVRGLKRNVPGMANWVVRGETVSGQVQIATAATLGVFECAITVVRSVSNEQPGVIRVSGRQRSGPIRWNATMHVVVAAADAGATRIDLTADIRVSGGGHTIDSGDVAKALRAAVSSLDDVGHGAVGRPDNAARNGRESDSNPVANERDNAGRASTCSMSPVADRQRGAVLLVVGLALGILVGRALGRNAARVVTRDSAVSSRRR
jgi:carbon monoxide dehydrogenase subunit G